MNLTKMISTQPKQFTPDQNNLDDPKSIFRPIEGQGISL